MKKVPGKYLHGYEAVYKLEKQRSREKKDGAGMLTGFSMLLKQPYVFGIFLTIFFYEIINSILSYHRVRISDIHAIRLTEGNFSSSEMALFLFVLVFVVHFVGFWISLFGTRRLLECLGEKRALLFIPLINAVLLISLFTIYD